MTTPARNVWDKRASETARAYYVFTVYRDLGNGRSLAKAGREVGTHKTVLERWSSKHEWVARVQAFDLHTEALRRQAFEAEHVRAAENHARQAAAALSVLQIPARALIEELQRDPDGLVERLMKEEKKLAPVLELVIRAGRVIPQLQAAERTARGQPGEYTANVNVNVEVEPDDDTDTVAELLAILGEVGVLPPDSAATPPSGDTVDTEAQ